MGNGVNGVLVMAQPWPSMARTVYRDHQRYLTTYMSQYPGYYFTGDGAIRDKDGFLWITGRVDDVKGQVVFAYAILGQGVEETEDLCKDLRNQVRKVIGPFAAPQQVLVVPGVPKTRSGKIMRRILRKIACNEFDRLGDITTLADSAVVQAIIDKKKASM